MRRLCLFIALAVAAVEVAGGQEAAPVRSGTMNLSRLADAEGNMPPAVEREFDPPVRIPRRVLSSEALLQLRQQQEGAHAPLSVSTPGVQAYALPGVFSPASSLDFQGINDSGSTIPPDTDGAVGPNHVMVAVNSEVNILDRTGKSLKRLGEDSFWSPVVAFRSFDPKVIYDSNSDRWLFTMLGSPQSVTSSLELAISDTGDPTGNWHEYLITAGHDNLWADFPYIGINKQWITISVNLFDVTSGSFGGADIYVFDKAALYAGPDKVTCSTTAAIPCQRLHIQNEGAIAPVITLDQTLATQYLIEDMGGQPDGTGGLKIYRITGAVASPILDSGRFITVADGWDETGPSNGVDIAPESGDTHKIDNGDARVINALYRNGSIWMAHTVFLPFSNGNSAPAGTASHSAAQWFQVDPVSLAIKQQGRVEDPKGAIYYAYPSIAVNKQGDALLGYTRFSASQFPSADYSFHAAGDPAGSMQADLAYHNGVASYFKTFGGTHNRWGDYSVTWVDPVNDLDFWTQQEYAEFNLGGSHWGVWWAKVTAPIVAADFGASPASADLGSQLVGGTLGTSITFKNSTTNVVNVSSVSITGPFTETDDCSGSAIAAGAGCAVNVVFTAADPAGSKSGVLTVFHDAQGGQTSVPLSATSVDFTLAVNRPSRSIRASGAPATQASVQVSVSGGPERPVTFACRAPRMYVCEVSPASTTTENLAASATVRIGTASAERSSRLRAKAARGASVIVSATIGGVTRSTRIFLASE